MANLTEGAATEGWEAAEAPVTENSESITAIKMDSITEEISKEFKDLITERVTTVRTDIKQMWYISSLFFIRTKLQIVKPKKFNVIL